MPAPEHRLGIDVGGTNTDAVIMDPGDRVIAKAKVPCTPDITGGITRAIDTVLRAPGADPRRISHVMLGTTHATNAVLERRNLRRVAVIRIGAPATLSVRPMFGWPRDLAEKPGDGVGVQGGQVPAVELDAAVHDRAAHNEARLMHHQPLRMVDVLP